MISGATFTSKAASLWRTPKRRA
ncbi:MAG: hypothetical protein ACLUHG_02810 [Sutterella wadsworthensis]